MVRLDSPGRGFGESHAIDRERAARGDGALAREGVQARTERVELVLEHARGAVGLHAFQGVGAHQLGEPVGLVHGRGGFGTHLDEPDRDSAIGELQRGLRPRQAGAYDFHDIRHAC